MKDQIKAIMALYPELACMIQDDHAKACITKAFYDKLITYDECVEYYTFVSDGLL